MKKVMFIIVGMLFAVTVNAASLTITEVSGGFSAVTGTNTGGEIVNNGSDEVHVNSGTLNETFSHTFDVTNSGVAGAFRLWVNGTASSGSNISDFSVLVDGNEIASAGPIAPFDIYGVGVFNEILLAAGETISLVVSGAFDSASYGLTLATPIPAALFLFAPALLGFFGLRRKAAVAA